MSLAEKCAQILKLRAEFIFKILQTSYCRVTRNFFVMPTRAPAPLDIINYEQ